MPPHPKIAFLRSPAAQALLGAVQGDPRDDLAVAQDKALAGLEAWQRAALLEQRALRLKGLAKQTRSGDMLWTPLGQQQMTAEILARYKAERFRNHTGWVADVCCGLGGDSFHLPETVRVAGCDSDAETLAAYAWNVRLHRREAAVLADAARLPLRVEAFLCDPARRAFAGSPRHYAQEEPQPGWEVLRDLLGRIPSAGLKLPPGSAPPEFLEDAEWEYLGVEDSCRELMVWTGTLGKRGWVRAVELPQGESVEAPRDEVIASFDGADGAEEPGRYVFEPVKAVVRAHLFGILAQRHGLSPLDARLAYLTGDSKPATRLLKAYRVLETVPLEEKALKRRLRERDIGILEIKKRGLALEPESFRKKLALQGTEAATLIATRIGGRKTGILAVPEA